MMYRITLIALASLLSGCVAANDPPNIIFIYVDDLGYGDLSVYGNEAIETKHIDLLAAEGTRFTRFYNNSPICSPSRVAVITGQYPHRWHIHSYLDSRQRNRQRHMAHWLDPEAPSLARFLQAAGYATLHAGKWHMGGGRDVGDAPKPTAYGFDDSLTSFEGLGDRILIRGNRLSQWNAEHGGEIAWVDKHEMTERYVDRAITFIRAHRDQPFYVQLWPDDVHDPYDPKPELLERFADTSHPAYYAVLYEMDRQIGRLIDEMDALGLTQKTLVIFASDDGPTAWPHYYGNRGDPGLAPGSTGGLRGRKWSLYEGGLRAPLIVRQPGTVPAGQVNERTVLAAYDLLPSLARIVGMALPEDYEPDGRDFSDALLGLAEPERDGAIMWEYGTLPAVGLRPGLKRDQSPPLAIREGDWKLLMNAEGGERELYNIVTDPGETENLIEAHPDKAERLSGQLLAWWQTMPPAEHVAGAMNK